jgi:hypothetical protein
MEILGMMEILRTTFEWIELNRIELGSTMLKGVDGSYAIEFTYQHEIT